MHRDLKPENIFATQAGIKLLDFGLAKFFNPDPAAETQAIEYATQAGLIVGTGPYMSPEQAEGRRVDERSDVFSFGTVLYATFLNRSRWSSRSASERVRLNDSARRLI